jgi:transcriptional regulator with XRE-family HTH domain
MQTFGELLTEYMTRTGISDSELARTLGISRQTVFRWKEGQVARPRHRDDVLVCARRLRLSPDERDRLLLAAGFAPEAAVADGESGAVAPNAPAPPAPSTQPELDGSDRSDRSDGSDASMPTSSPARPRRPARRRRWLLAAMVVVVVGVALAVAMKAWPGLQPPQYPVARSGESLIVIAPPSLAASPGQVDGTDAMVSALQREIIDLRLANQRVARWPTGIADAASAEAARRRASATVLAWRTAAGDPTLHLAVGKNGVGTDEALPLAADQPDAARVAALVALADAAGARGDGDGARAFLVQALALVPVGAAAHDVLSGRIGP